jgi:superfamily II DNA/RNA helicase
VPNSTARRAARATKPHHKQTRDGGRTQHTTRYNGNDRTESRDRHSGDRNDNRDNNRGGYRNAADRTGNRDDRRDDNRRTGDRTESRYDRRDGDRGGYRANTTDTRRGYRDDAPARGRNTDRRNPRQDTTDWSTGERRQHGDRSSNRRDFRDDRPAARGGRDDRSGTYGRRDFRDERPAAGRRDFRDERSAPGQRRDSGRDSGRGQGDFRDRPDRRPAAGRYTDPAVETRASTEPGTHWDGDITESGRTQPSVSFAELGLPTPLLHALEAAGITSPFPIQAATLPDALGGRDVLGRAQTGSGKTLAFGLALLTRLQKGKARPGHPRALVLVPTRELAMQVTDALMPLAKSLGLWCRTVVGGMSFGKQTEQLQRGIDLLIATPGRLSDHVRQGTCVLDDVRFVTLDEADQMADMGFLPQVRAILDLVPDGQRMLFSATLDRDVTALVDRYLTDPVTHSVSPATATVSTMDHHLLLVTREDKPAVVTEMAARDGRTIMFLRTKHHVDRLTRQLRSVGVHAGALHGGKPQGARNRVLGEFKDGRLPVLVATDVAARGIHVDGISLVVHVDPPADAKGYLHRAGRTARAGEAGTVVTLVTHQERRTVFRMTEQAGVEPERTKVRPGDDDLVRITGARTPSGEPVADEPIRRPASRPGRFNRRAQRPGR